MRQQVDAILVFHDRKRDRATKISQRLIQIFEFRGLPQHARPLTPRPIIDLVGICRAKITAGLNLQLPQLKLLLTTRDYADIGTMRDGITALDRGLSATLCVPRAEASHPSS